MKNKHVLEVHFQSRKDFLRDARRALSKREPLLQPEHHIFFESVAGFRKFMTIQKIEILTTISNRKPSSIYELAKFVDRDFAAVLRDCMSLEGAGFMKFRAARNAKKTKMPILVFDYVAIAIELPKSPYQIEFKHAA